MARPKKEKTEDGKDTSKQDSADLYQEPTEDK